MTLEEARDIPQGLKVKYRGKVYDFGYISQTGRCVIYEEGECNMQDALAVEPEGLEHVDIELGAPTPPSAGLIAAWLRHEGKIRNMQAFQTAGWMAAADAIEEHFGEALDAQIEKTTEAELERDRLRQVIVEIDSLESQARSGDAGALLEAEAKKVRGEQP